MLRPILLAVAALLICPPVALFADDCAGCEPDNMCIKHEKEQADALKSFAASWKSSDTMKRLAALNLVGGLNDRHMNCRSKSVADAIAPMMEDADSGVRQRALEIMKSNQHVPSAIGHIGKLLDRLFSKLNKPKPGGKVHSAAQLEYENAVLFAKELLSALAAFPTSPEIAPFFVKGIESKCSEISIDAAQKSAGIRRPEIVSAYLRRLETVVPPKNDLEKKAVYDALYAAFQGLSGCPEINNNPDDPDPWLQKATAWWKAHQDEFGK